jgi:hypothetical protein
MVCMCDICFIVLKECVGDCVCVYVCVCVLNCVRENVLKNVHVCVKSMFVLGGGGMRVRVS